MTVNIKDIKAKSGQKKHNIHIISGTNFISPEILSYEMANILSAMY